MININSEYFSNDTERMEKKIFSHSSSPRHEDDFSLMELMEESSNFGLNTFNYEDEIKSEGNENSLIQNQFSLFAPQESNFLYSLKEEEKKYIIENQDINKGIKTNQSSLEKEDSSKQCTNSLTGKKRRKGNKDDLNKKSKNPHDKYSSDNLLRKIQVHYLSFIISFLNDILKHSNYRHEFLNLDYEFKKKVKKEFVESLKSKSIGEIICNKVSDKYRKYDENTNADIYKILQNDEVLNKILSENYTQLFRKIYFYSNRMVNLKEYGINKDIILSKKVKMFQDLFKRFDEDKEYQKKLNECANKNFFTHLFSIK